MSLPQVRLVGSLIALVAPAAALTLNADTIFTFAEQVNHVLIQNNSSTNITVEFDAVATLGSIVVAAGQYLYLDLPVTKVHILGSAATNVNGSTGANIILKGWA